MLFHPSDEESLKSLTTLLGGNNGAGGNNASGLAGCVHFSGVPNCDIKVLILLYSPGKKVFLGFIPNDQTNFVKLVLIGQTIHSKLVFIVSEFLVGFG